MTDDQADNLNRPFYLPRLPDDAYRGKAHVHWTLTTAERQTGWLSPTFHSAFREIMLHTQVRGSLICPVYCLMPDHLHLIWMGCAESSDQQQSMAFLRTYLEPLLSPAKFQHQAHDHVLRKEERQEDAFMNACGYILLNPVRKNLATRPEVWPFTGCMVPGYPKLHPCDDNYQAKLWRIYSRACDRHS